MVLTVEKSSSLEVLNLSTDITEGTTVEQGELEGLF